MHSFRVRFFLEVYSVAVWPILGKGVVGGGGGGGYKRSSDGS